MSASERMVMINGAKACLEVQGGADDPTVLLVGSSMVSWPDGLCERLVAGGRRVIRYDVRDTGRSESYLPGDPGVLPRRPRRGRGRCARRDRDRACPRRRDVDRRLDRPVARPRPPRAGRHARAGRQPTERARSGRRRPPEHHGALMKVITNTPEPDWSHERAVIDHLVLQARTFAGAGAFDEASARARRGRGRPAHAVPAVADELLAHTAD